MNKSELKKKLFDNGIESSMLDDMVHDAANVMASKINNDSIESQIDFLIDICNFSPEYIISEVLED